MASNVQSFLGNYSDLFAVAGVVSVSYIALKLALSIFNGIKVFLLAKPLGLTKNFKKCGQWAVVTGATDGIGKGYTHQLAKKGMDIILISRTKSKLEDCAKEIEQKFKVKTKIIVADFSAGLQIYDAIRSQLAGLDIGVLVNNVGMSYDFPMYFLEIPDREKKIMDLLHVNITSVTMAFVHYFSLCLEREYRDRGITVQSVLPYFVATKMSKVKKGSFWIPYPDQYAASALDTVGFEKATNGWWSHSITGWLLDVIPKQTQMSILVRILLEKKKGAPIKRLNGSKTD
ncbi:very-long-chain 3-oxoacyl-CoA reductase-like isoform X3 [Mytilus galloprovincialis]|uniref:very-long-chain 3-oxoacyl-CoA reductase-like isoform X3 n=1 Tax=Mytilus galloprovincialis TaxID=29158 RepID=UPI003F7B3991